MTNEQKCKKLHEKAECIGFITFHEHRHGVELRKIKTVINNPFKFGFTVLELSKLQINCVHSDYSLKKDAMAKMIFADNESINKWMEMTDF